jgi:hypothetical protein
VGDNKLFLKLEFDERFHSSAQNPFTVAAGGENEARHIDFGGGDLHVFRFPDKFEFRRPGPQRSLWT